MCISFPSLLQVKFHAWPSLDLNLLGALVICSQKTVSARTYMRHMRPIACFSTRKSPIHTHIAFLMMLNTLFNPFPFDNDDRELLHGCNFPSHSPLSLLPSPRHPSSPSGATFDINGQELDDFRLPTTWSRSALLSTACLLRLNSLPISSSRSLRVRFFGGPPRKRTVFVSFEPSVLLLSSGAVPSFHSCSSSSSSSASARGSLEGLPSIAFNFPEAI